MSDTQFNTSGKPRPLARDLASLGLDDYRDTELRPTNVQPVGCQRAGSIP
jgi:hypothetical protein